MGPCFISSSPPAVRRHPGADTDLTSVSFAAFASGRARVEGTPPDIAFRCASPPCSPIVCADREKETRNMTSMDQDRWTRVKDRLRADVGDDVYSSWFARMELDGSEGDTVKLSVPTRFLKSWIQSHYAERVLSCWQAEQPGFSRIELTVRSAVIRTLPP